MPDFIREVVLGKRLTQRQVIVAIRTYDFRLVRTLTAFEEPLNVPCVDPKLIHMHARLRLIGGAFSGKIEWMEGKRPS